MSVKNRTEKYCPQCGETKLIGEFYKNCLSPDGHAGWCKPCFLKKKSQYDKTEKAKKTKEKYFSSKHWKEISKMWRQSPNGIKSRKERKKEHLQTDKGKNTAKKQAKRYRSRPENKIKENARREVGFAKKDGRINPQPCEICGSNHRIEAHHEDYSRPLDIIWLCKKHHAWIHCNVVLYSK